MTPQSRPPHWYTSSNNVKSISRRPYLPIVPFPKGQAFKCMSLWAPYLFKPTYTERPEEGIESLWARMVAIHQTWVLGIKHGFFTIAICTLNQYSHIYSPSSFFHPISSLDTYTGTYVDCVRIESHQSELFCYSVLSFLVLSKWWIQSPWIISFPVIMAGHL